MQLYLFVVLVLSTWRWTHFVVEDTFPLVAKPREWITRRKPMGMLAYLVGCTFCSSVWIAAAHVGALYLFMDISVEAPVALGAALSVLAAFGEAVLARIDVGTPILLEASVEEIEPPGEAIQ